MILWVFLLFYAKIMFSLPLNEEMNKISIVLLILLKIKENPIYFYRFSGCSYYFKTIFSCKHP